MNKLASLLGALSIMILLIAGGYYALSKHAATTDTNKDKYALAYEGHALGEPFNLLSKVYKDGQWMYFYQITTTPELAVPQIQAQLSGGGYQVVASHPDTSSTVYRDLITGDVSVKAIVSKTANGQTGVSVSVYGIGKE